MLAPGTLVDRFRVGHPVATGGSGAVYRASDEERGEPVALKVLHDASVDCRKRFDREVANLVKLTSRHVARYVGHGVTREGRPFLAMEWIEGESLASALARGRLAVAESITIALGIASGLEVLHRRGIIHRDVKPANVMLRHRSTSDVVLVDLGISRVIGAPSSLTNQQAIGTPGYLAPEQVTGEADIDARADVFALGCVLYHSLAGQAPYVADSLVALLLKAAFEPPPRLRDAWPEVPPEIDVLVHAMMARDRNARIGTIAEVMKRLAALPRDAPNPEPTSERPRPSLTSSGTFPACLLVFGAAFDPQAGPPAHLVQAISAIAAEQGATFHTFPNGTIALSFSTARGSDDVPVRAAACALATSALVRSGPRCLVSGSLAGADPAGARAMFHRAVSLLDVHRDERQREGAGLWLDEPLADLLRRHFDVADTPHGAVLIGERTDLHDTIQTGAFVGRDAEVALLRSRFAAVLSDRSMAAVVVVAEAGMGKSRLRIEVLRHLGDKAKVLSTRGDPSAKGSTLSALRALLRSALPTVGADEGARGRLTALVGPLFAPDVRAVSLEFLAEVMDLPADAPPSLAIVSARRDPRIMADGIRRAWFEYLAAESERTPVALLIEDLQWVDRVSLDLFGRTLRELEEAPVLVIAFARPEIEERLPTLWQDVGASTLRLSALSRNDSVALVRTVLGAQCTPEAALRIADRGGGNPFFLEQLSSSLARGDTATLPESVMVALQQRFTRFSEDARRALRAASILADAFGEDDLRALLGADCAASEALEELAAEGLIRAKRRTRPGVPQTFSFRHDLLREAAYATLSEEDRTVGHLLAGTWLEQVAELRGAPDPFVLADHFERGSAPERAARHYERAARVAFEGNDFEAAISLAERALRHIPDPHARARLFCLRSECAVWSAHGAAEKFTEEAILGSPRGSTEWYRAVGALLSAGEATRDRAKLQRAVQLLATAFSVPRAEAATDAIAFAWSSAVRVLVLGGVTELAMQFQVRLRELTVLDPSPLTLGWAAIGEQFVARFVHADLLESRRTAEEALAAFEEAGDPRAAAICKISLAAAHLDLGELEACAAICESVVPRAAALGIDFVVAQGRWMYGMALGYLGRLDEAEEALRSSKALFRAAAPTQFVGVQRSLATVLMLAGRLEEAEEEARGAVSATTMDGPVKGFARAVLARILVARGKIAEAREVAELCLANEEATGGDVKVVGRLALAEACAAAGDEDRARQIAREAVDILRQRSSALTDRERASFYGRNPAHRRILEIAGEALPEIGE